MSDIDLNPDHPSIASLKPGDLFRIDAPDQPPRILGGSDGLIWVTPTRGIYRVLENGPSGVRYERASEADVAKVRARGLP